MPHICHVQHVTKCDCTRYLCQYCRVKCSDCGSNNSDSNSNSTNNYNNKNSVYYCDTCQYNVDNDCINDPTLICCSRMYKPDDSNANVVVCYACLLRRINTTKLVDTINKPAV